MCVPDHLSGMAEYASPEEIQAFLEGVTYPISKRTLLETAREEGASERLLRTIEALPDDYYRDHHGLHTDLNHVATAG
jgi:hypothetical protein